MAGGARRLHVVGQGPTRSSTHEAVMETSLKTHCARGKVPPAFKSYPVWTTGTRYNVVLMLAADSMLASALDLRSVHPFTF